MRLLRVAGAVSTLVVAALLAGGGSAAVARTITLREYRLSETKLMQLRTDWANQLRSRYGTDTWAPMEFELSNRDLRIMGLPPRRVLLAHRYRVPTAVYPNGKMVRLAGRKSRGGRKGGGSNGSGPGGSTSSPGVTTVAGAGFFGIRPGAWLLLLNENSVGWCSLAHVYGTPGNYMISTAGHCGKPGDIGTVIGAVGGHKVNGQPVPVLLDFGAFKSSQDAGLGKDWALLSIYSQYQRLASPTMAFWGGPIGMYTAEGELVDLNLTGNHLQLPTVDPNPALVQQIVHYGHGAGIGAGGTPRTGTAITWKPTYFMFSGAISPGDSGSGANTLSGDSIGSNREAAGIITHLWIDSLMRQGLGIMAGTRATQVQATLANGQILPYPAPAAGLP